MTEAAWSRQSYSSLSSSSAALFILPVCVRIKYVYACMHACMHVCVCVCMHARVCVCECVLCIERDQCTEVQEDKSVGKYKRKSAPPPPPPNADADATAHAHA